MKVRTGTAKSGDLDIVYEDFGDEDDPAVLLIMGLGAQLLLWRKDFCEKLVNQGLLIRRRGIGTTVANQMVHRKAELTSLYDDLAREGRTPRTEVLALDCAAQDDRAAAVLEVPLGTPLVAIVRLRYADDLPLAIMRNWLPPALNDLSLDELTSDGLYAVLRARGIRPTVARQRIGARNATAEERRTLHMSKAEPLITMTRSAYAADGTPVEYGSHCYRADQYSVDVVVSER